MFRNKDLGGIMLLWNATFITEVFLNRKLLNKLILLSFIFMRIKLPLLEDKIYWRLRLDRIITRHITKNESELLQASNIFIKNLNPDKLTRIAHKILEFDLTHCIKLNSYMRNK